MSEVDTEPVENNNNDLIDDTHERGDNIQARARRNGDCLKCGTIIGRCVVCCYFRFEF